MRTPRRAAVAVAVATALLVGACASGDGGGDADAPPDATATTGSLPLNDDGSAVQKAAGPPQPAEPARHLGPQGRVGQFVVLCSYSHSGPSDPIVHHAMAGMSHRHDFYGFTETDESTTAGEMVEGQTTCDKTPDTAAYWHPTLYDGDEVVEPLDLNAYYRAAPGVDPADVEPMPLGLALIAGDQFATEPQPGEATGWTCGTRTTLSDDPPTCPASAPLHLVLTFQDCWDGKYLDSEDHVSHAAYSVDGECPDEQPVHIPQLTMSVRFPVYGEGRDLRLASGSIYSAHGDFLNGWDPQGLQREIEACIHREAVCDLASNRQEEAIFQVQ